MFEKKGKVNKNDIESARKNAAILINHLIEFGQRCDLVTLDKSRMQIMYGSEKSKEKAELMLTDSVAFLIQGSTIRKITTKLEESNLEEVNKAAMEQKGKVQLKISPKIFDILKKELGEFEIIL